MLRKVKNKAYKSKREFQDDLDLIWSNCFHYNSTEVRHVYFRATRSELTLATESPSTTMCYASERQGDEASQVHY